MRLEFIGLEKMDKSDTKRIKRRLHQLDAATSIMLTLIIGFTIYIIIDLENFVNSYYIIRMSPREKMGLIAGNFFALAGILFFITSLKTVLRIKRFFPEFYTDHKCVLYLSIFGLSLPILMRATYDLLKITDFFMDYLEESNSHIQAANTLAFIIGDIIPISF